MRVLLEIRERGELAVLVISRAVMPRGAPFSRDGPVARPA